MAYEPGKILLVSYPFTDQSAAKQRPVLVVSGVKFNRGDDIVIVPMSSRVVPGDPFGFAINSTDSFFPQTGLRVSSTVKWTKPVVMGAKQAVVKPLGNIPLDVLGEIQKLVRSVFS